MNRNRKFSNRGGVPSFLNKLPDRWEDYTNSGNRIPGTRFICMKVPLKEELCQNNNIDPERQFTPTRMVSELAQRGMNLGLLIDLTNTKRYYHPKEITGLGIAYEKIFVEGHEVPSRQVVRQFYAVIDQFEKAPQTTTDVDQSNSTVIGVHCTHGINRTGYLVCRYLIERMGWTVEKAIKEFNGARGHAIERENYLKALECLELESEDDGRDQLPAAEAESSNLQADQETGEHGYGSSAGRRRDNRYDNGSAPDQTDGHPKRDWKHRTDWQERNGPSYQDRYRNRGGSYRHGHSNNPYAPYRENYSYDGRRRDYHGRTDYNYDQNGNRRHPDLHQQSEYRSGRRRHPYNGPYTGRNATHRDQERQ